LKSALKDFPDYDLIVTGHSLGAGTAELIALSILMGKVEFIDPGRF
jgi:putative lipase involved disintegration of autophagic bodies